MSLENYPSFLLNFSEQEMNGEDKITAENKIGIRNFSSRILFNLENPNTAFSRLH